MLSDLFGGLNPSSHVSEAFMWRWAAEHPYLFTLIKVMQPYVAVIVVVAGVSIVRSLWRRA